MNKSYLPAMLFLLIGILVGRFTAFAPVLPKVDQGSQPLASARNSSGANPPAPETQPSAYQPIQPSADPPLAEENKILSEPRIVSPVRSAGNLSLLEIAIEEQNLTAIWQLLFDLIAARHFTEVDLLYERFADAFNGGDLNSPFWMDGALFQGPLLREFADNEIAVLEYLVHLSRLDAPGELLGDLRKELLEEEAISTILGFNEGRAAALTNQLTPYYKDLVENWSSATFNNRSILLALGHIPTDDSAELLIEILPWIKSSLKLSLVRALGSNGTPAAIEALRQLADDDKNPTTRRAAQDALNLLGD